MADEIVRLSEVLKSVGEKYNLMEDELTNARNIQQNFNENEQILREYEEKILIMKTENDKMADYVRHADRYPKF